MIIQFCYHLLRRANMSAFLIVLSVKLVKWGFYTLKKPIETVITQNAGFFIKSTLLGFCMKPQEFSKPC